MNNSKHYWGNELANRTNACPHCGGELAGAIIRSAGAAAPKSESVHMHGGDFAVRESLGVVVIGECRKHGLVRFFPKGRPVIQPMV